MNLDTHITDLARELLITTMLLAGPVLLVGLVVGIAVSLFQALTSVQEQTLSLVPKMLAVMLVVLLLLARAEDARGDARRAAPARAGAADPRRLHVARLRPARLVRALVTMDALPPGTLEAFGLYLTRTSALVVAAPLFGTGTGFAAWRIGLIVALALVFYGVTGTPLPHEPAPVEYALLVLREVLVGVFLALTLQMIVVAVRVAGELIGTEMGFNMASQIDPTTNIQTPVVTQVYELLFFLGLLAIDGHHLILRALERSFERAPVGVVAFTHDAGWMLLTLFQQMFVAGITIAAPVLLLLMLASVLVGLIGRAVPQINVMDIGFTARIGVGLVALLVFAPFLAPAFGELYAGFMGGLDRALDTIAS
jgi:flagellar biosynthesis protein FliR